VIQVKTEKMAAPVKYLLTIDENDLEERKKKAYEKIKGTIEVQGFRKGNVPQDIAETRLGVERLYKSVIDEIYFEIAQKEPIISSSDFKFFGDLKKKSSLTIEFVAEVKPTAKLVDFNKIKEQVKIEEVQVTEDDLKSRIDFEIKQLETIEDTTKDTLENLDIAIIDFEGRLVGEEKPFKGGTAKGFQIRVNDIVNGQKQFVDNFEDQLVGMKLNETKEVKVTFPSNYRDTSLAGKNASFIVTLKSIKIKISPVYDEELAKKKGFDSLKDYEESLKRSIFEIKQRKAIENFKKKVVTEIVNQSEISPIPESMIENENVKEWEAFLRRMNRSEEQFVKENKISKEMFFENNTPRSIEVLKATTILNQVAKDRNITASEEEVVKYVMNVTNLLKYDKDREEKIKQELKTNLHQYSLMENATINEKVIEFLFNEIKS
jgi:trigger factor